MTKQTRRRHTPEQKEQAVACLSEDGVTYASLAGELGVTSSKHKSLLLENRWKQSGGYCAVKTSG